MDSLIMSNNEQQKDELLVLENIYLDSFNFDSKQSGESPSGEIRVSVQLPKNFTVVHVTVKNGLVERETSDVQYLPPVFLHFTFPHNYPSEAPPNFILSCKWLNKYQLSVLCQSLDDIWNENEGEVIMYTWVQFLADEALTTLGILETLFIYNSPCDNTSNGTCDIRAVQDISECSDLLKFLKNFNCDTNKKIFDTQLFNCKVCFQDKLGSNFIAFWPCNHIYCKACMKKFFEIQIQEDLTYYLTCPNSDCSSQANPKQVKELVSEDLYKRWDDMLLNSTLSSLGDIQFCPRKHCQYPVTIENNQGSCPECNFVFCSFCRYSWHGIEPCRLKSKDLEEIIKGFMSGDYDTKSRLEKQYGVKYLTKLKDEYLTASYLSENTKLCPKCRSSIQKSGGCNKMTCQKCSSHFCWLCLKVLNNGNPYYHFNEEGLECYNRLFENSGDDIEIYFEDE